MAPSLVLVHLQQGKVGGKLCRGQNGYLMQQHMSEKAKQGRRGRGKGAGDQPSPQWADGLRNIYDSVVNEPLPDDMLALLASLDADGDK